MDLIQAMQERHSVRAYTDRPIEGEVAEKLRDFVRRCAGESGLHLELVTDEPTAFDGPMAHYGKFSGVRNYIVLAGKKAPDLDERCGYYGEKIVLYAQTLGLNTCWVALTYKKGAVRVQLNGPSHPGGSGPVNIDSPGRRFGVHICGKHHCRCRRKGHGPCKHFLTHHFFLLLIRLLCQRVPS